MNLSTANEPYSTISEFGGNILFLLRTRCFIIFMSHDMWCQVPFLRGLCDWLVTSGAAYVSGQDPDLCSIMNCVVSIAYMFVFAVLYQGNVLC